MGTWILAFHPHLFIVSYYRKQIGEVLAKLHLVVKESDHLILVAIVGIFNSSWFKLTK